MQYTHIFTDPSLTTLFQLIVACVLGGALGLERSIHHKPVGFKTCLIMALSTCLLTIVSIKSAELYSTMTGHISSDPMRLAAQIVSGIGFLGTGVIMHRSNDMVSGITTAAMIWTASGIGIAVGAGFYIDAAIITALILVVLKFSTAFVGLFQKNRRLINFTVHLGISDAKDIDTVLESLKAQGCSIETIDFKDGSPDKSVAVTLTGNLVEKSTELHIYETLKALECVNNVDVKYLITD
jgi:putative Mg2+ transporter-C (MgtC) family protein